MHQSFFRPNYIFNNDAYFLDFLHTKIPFNPLNPFKHQQALHFGVLNYEKQHKEGTRKVSGRSVVFAAFYADFCLFPKLVIITTLSMWDCIHKCIFMGDVLLKSLTFFSILINRDNFGRHGNQENCNIPKRFSFSS